MEPVTGRGLCKSQVDLILATSGAFCASAERWLGETRDVRCYFVGPLRQAAFTHSTRGVFVTGLRIRPGRAHRLLKTSAHELASSPATVRELWPKVTSSEVEQAAHASTFAERVRLLERMTLAQVTRREPVDLEVRAALHLIESTHGRLSVDRLLSHMDIGARQLERKFREQVGVTPKKLCQIARVQLALALLRRQPRPSWSRIAVECGFYDQPHFIRHFKAVTGTAPNAYLAEPTLKLSEK